LQTQNDIIYNSDSILQTQNDIIYNSDSILQTQNDIIYNSDSILQIQNDTFHNSDIDIKGTIDKIHNSDISLNQAKKYTLIKKLINKILGIEDENLIYPLSLNSNNENKVNLFGFSTDYIEITVTKKTTSTLTIPEDAASHSIVVQAEVNKVERDNYNEDTAKRTAVADGTEVVFEIKNSTGNVTIGPSVVETKNGVAETNLAIKASEDVNKVDVEIVAYLNQ
jgi:hypothetical protein